MSAENSLRLLLFIGTTQLLRGFRYTKNGRNIPPVSVHSVLTKQTQHRSAVRHKHFLRVHGQLVLGVG